MQTRTRHDQLLVPIIWSERSVDVRRLRSVSGTVTQTGNAERCIGVADANTLDSIEHKFVGSADIKNCNMDTFATPQDIAFPRAIYALLMKVK